MNILLSIAAIISIWHFIYEVIIAPSIRLNLRNRLFKLRDELRQIKIDGISSQDEKAFWFVHDGINNFLNRIPSLTLERVKALDAEYENNKALKRVMNEHLSAVKNSSDLRIKDVFTKTNSVIGAAIITNMGGWFIYLIPICFIVLTMKKLSNYASELIVAPTKDVERLMPSA